MRGNRFFSNGLDPAVERKRMRSRPTRSRRILGRSISAAHPTWTEVNEFQPRLLDNRVRPAAGYNDHRKNHRPPQKHPPLKTRIVSPPEFRSPRDRSHGTPSIEPLEKYNRAPPGSVETRGSAGLTTPNATVACAADFDILSPAGEPSQRRQPLFRSQSGGITDEADGRPQNAIGLFCGGGSSASNRPVRLSRILERLAPLTEHQTAQFRCA